MTPSQGLRLALLVTLLVAAGCANAPARTDDASHAFHVAAPGSRPEGARLTTDEVLDIARQVVQSQGAGLDHYNAPSARYELAQGKLIWWVDFDGRVPMPGNHCSVSVDDRTGEATLWRGR